MIGEMIDNYVADAKKKHGKQSVNARLNDIFEYRNVISLNVTRLVHPNSISNYPFCVRQAPYRTFM